MEKSQTDSAREQRIRRQLKKEGLILQKSRTRSTNVDDYGQYRIIDSNNNIVAGERWDLTLDYLEKDLKGN
jgi:hypothetical protein